MTESIALPLGFDDELRVELSRLDADGLRRVLVHRNGDVINLSSNDYLGLSRHPDVIGAAVAATQSLGTGAGASRLLGGTSAPHDELESAVASFLGREAALVFPSGYHVNTGLLPALVGAGDIVFFDRLCHASLIDGVRLSGARFAAFDHNDMNDLEAQLKKRRSSRRRAVIATEGFFSMDGDLPPLAELVSLARTWNALLYVDEAHSFGLTGPDGRGVAAQAGLLPQIDLFVGTLSKTLGSQGGFVAGSRPLIDWLISRCRSFLFTTGLAPAAAASATKALDLLPTMENRRRRVQLEAENFRRDLQRRGFDTLASASPIVPVWTGDVGAGRALSSHLLSKGFFVPSIRPPTVPNGEGRVRLSITWDVTQNGLDALRQAFADYGSRPHRRKTALVPIG